MAHDPWTSVLVLGGIRSGKSEYAEALAAQALAAGRSTVRYLATGKADADDAVWTARIEAHQARRPEEWVTQEIGDPTDLLHALGTATADEVLLVDDLGGWAVGLLDLDAAARKERIDGLVWAIGAAKSAVVIVGSEVGLSLVPATEVGARYADLVGEINQAVAGAAGRVALIVAGQPTWLKEGNVRTIPSARPASQPAEATDLAVPEVVKPSADQPLTAALTESTMSLPMVATGLVIQANMELPLPDEEAERDSRARLATLDLAGSGLGKLTKIVQFAAATQHTPTPRPWQNPRLMLLYADHDGGIAEGVTRADSAHRAAQARAGEGPIGLLAARAGATIQVIDAATAGAIEWVDAATAEAVEAGLRHGWRLAEDAVDAGVDLFVLGACGAGADSVAAAVVSATTSAEVAGLMGRRVGPDGIVDDTSWMIRCGTARDALQRVRRNGLQPKELLAGLGGVDLAIAVGLLLGATARRTPVLMDGPVGVAAGMLARDLAAQSRHWCILPDHGGDPATRLGADVLGMEQFLDLKLGLGEGATALALLPLLQGVLTLASTMLAASAPAMGRASVESAELQEAADDAGPTDDDLE
jgi:adenosyl cobinamide kinase/adenosyl cobinamide phosphate guanylyltransferase/NaMN:DMB phosphoribosyltransferase